MEFRSEASFRWLYSQKISKVKDLARMVQASYLWNGKYTYKDELISLKKEASWNSDLRDTARAASGLALTGTIYPDTEKWVLSRQSEGSWNNDVYDTVYALSSLADMGSYNLKGCTWLTENYSEKWEHPGTTALVITALIKQANLVNEKTHSKFIRDRAEWIISQKETEGAWRTPATSCLVIQSLILAGYKEDTEGPVSWLLSQMNDNGSWGKDGGNINTTSLALITLWGYLH